MDQVINFIAEYGFFLGLPLAFIAVVAWVYRPGAKKRYQADGNLPFYWDRKAGKNRPGGR
ncbi:MAG: CcoQ/FixQ family Cbb3-type cytochrome c oxidase assembly chaperone [Thiobacillus sp.]|nr:CcoQ/FixQ family Cbb3-type cytochrome c oxidase assembly chaperone [Thiobacillus sp.]